MIAVDKGAATQRSQPGLSLPFRDDPSDYCRHLSVFGEPVLLDSGGGNTRRRWDIIAAQSEPELSLTLYPQLSAAQLRTQLDRWRSVAIERCRPARNAHLGSAPFRGGFIGHLSYEFGRRLMGLPPARGCDLPLAAVHYYPWAVLQDRRERRAFLVADGGIPARELERIHARLLDSAGTGAAASAPSDASAPIDYRRYWDVDEFAVVFERVQAYIRAGDCYQINIGQPFRVPRGASLFDDYRTLRAVARAPYSAYFPLGGDNALLCLSPERFLCVDEGRVITSPIKGTRPRSADPEKDRDAAHALLSSDKERAENLMIVDLLRNDIGRFCKTGSVHVDRLFDVESYNTVHHLVSTVSGALHSSHSPIDVLFGCMPGGSITGAPKYRAMQIIDELEPAPRQAWCGSVFYWSSHGRLDSNIAIRTLFGEGDDLVCWAGGGLVSDSRLREEFAEQDHKVGALLRALYRQGR